MSRDPVGFRSPPPPPAGKPTWFKQLKDTLRGFLTAPPTPTREPPPWHPAPQISPSDGETSRPSVVTPPDSPNVPEAVFQEEIREWAGILPPLIGRNDVESNFFAKLPIEIRRMIYQEVWEWAGTKQHIYLSRTPKRLVLSRTPCIIDADAADEREETLYGLFTHRTVRPYWQSQRSATIPHPILAPWVRRVNSSWCNHWECEERHPEINRAPGAETDSKLAAPTIFSSEKTRSPFLAPLLVCKHMHSETRASMLESVTFSFIGPAALETFLRTTGSAELLRTVHLVSSWYVRSEPCDELKARALDVRWARMFSLLEHSPSLRELRIWVDAPYMSSWRPRRGWFEPLRADAFKCLTKFTVTMPLDESPSGEVDDLLRYAPFLLIRMPYVRRLDYDGRMRNSEEKRVRSALESGQLPLIKGELPPAKIRRGVPTTVWDD